MRIAGLMLAFLTAGCITVDNDSGGNWIRYACSGGRTIEARYDNSDAVNPRAELVLDGRRIGFYQVRSASGARYATQDGLRGGHGLIWWTQGNQATLFDYSLDPRLRPGGERPIATCAS
jgi:membrane-bound inhibitor of C-type lysozyme